MSEWILAIIVGGAWAWLMIDAVRDRIHIRQMLDRLDDLEKRFREDKP